MLRPKNEAKTSESSYMRVQKFTEVNEHQIVDFSSLWDSCFPQYNNNVFHM